MVGLSRGDGGGAIGGGGEVGETGGEAIERIVQAAEATQSTAQWLQAFEPQSRQQFPGVIFVLCEETVQPDDGLVDAAPV